VTQPDLISLVVEGLGNTAYLGDGRALAIVWKCGPAAAPVNPQAFTFAWAP
jgi:hypothetical protein